MVMNNHGDGMSIFSGNRLREMRWEDRGQEDCLDLGMRNECMDVNDEGWADNGGDNDRGRWSKETSHSRFSRLVMLEKRETIVTGEGELLTLKFLEGQKRW